MPVYDYRCEACGETREHILLGFSAPEPEACPACGKGPLLRAYSGAAPQIALNGWGFSKTDALLKDTRGKDFKQLKERAARIVEE